MRSLVRVLVLWPWFAVGSAALAIPTVTPPPLDASDRAAFAGEERQVRVLAARIGVVRAELARARAVARGEPERMQLDELDRAIRLARAEHGTSTEEVLRRRFEEADGLLDRAESRLSRARDRVDRSLDALDVLVARVESGAIDRVAEPSERVTPPAGVLAHGDVVRPAAARFTRSYLDPEAVRPEGPGPEARAIAARRVERLGLELQRLEVERDLAAATLELARARVATRKGHDLDLVPFEEAVRMARIALTQVSSEPRAAVARGDD